MSKAATKTASLNSVSHAASVAAALASREAVFEAVSVAAWRLGVAEATAQEAGEAATKMSDNRKSRDAFIFGYSMSYMVRRNYAPAMKAVAEDFPDWKPVILDSLVRNIAELALGPQMLAFGEYVFDKGVTQKDATKTVPAGKYRRSDMEAKAVKAATERWNNLWKTEEKKADEKAKRKANAGKAKKVQPKVSFARLPKAKDTADAVSMAKHAALAFERFCKDNAKFLPIELKDAGAALASVAREIK